MFGRRNHRTYIEKSCTTGCAASRFPIEVYLARCTQCTPPYLHPAHMPPFSCFGAMCRGLEAEALGWATWALRRIGKILMSCCGPPKFGPIPSRGAWPGLDLPQTRLQLCWEDGAALREPTAELSAPADCRRLMAGRSIPDFGNGVRGICVQSMSDQSPAGFR